MSRVSTKKPVSDPAAPLTPEQVWGRLLAWQARREHSRAELAGKLAGLGVVPDAAEPALDRLAELGLQNDDRYAEMLVRSQLQRGKGRQAIRQALQQRGLDRDHPALAEQADDLDWVARAVELLQRRFGDRAGESAHDERERARQVRFLQYRGFSLGQALGALKVLHQSC